MAEKFRLRRLIEAAEQIVYEAYQASDGGSDRAREVLDAAEASIFKIAESSIADEPQKLSELLQEELSRLDRALEGDRVTGLVTGFHDLDRKTSGFHGGELIVIAGRPSMGKTSLALNLAEQIALGGRAPFEPHRGEVPVPVAFFSLEMSKEAVSQRLISAQAGIDHQRIRTGEISADEFERAKDACSTLHHAPIYIDDAAALTVLQLRARARRLVRQHKIRCDGGPPPAPSRRRRPESRQTEVAAISRGSWVWRAMRVPVICSRSQPRVENRREPGPDVGPSRVWLGSSRMRTW